MLVESFDAHPMRATPCFAATGRWCKQATCWMCCWRPVTVASLLCTRTTCCGLFHDWVVSQVRWGPPCCSTTAAPLCFGVSLAWAPPSFSTHCAVSPHLFGMPSHFGCGFRSSPFLFCLSIHLSVAQRPLFPPPGPSSLSPTHTHWQWPFPAPPPPPLSYLTSGKSSSSSFVAAVQVNR
jgi:hypothetical protein